MADNMRVVALDLQEEGFARCIGIGEHMNV